MKIRQKGVPFFTNANSRVSHQTYCGGTSTNKLPGDAEGTQWQRSTAGLLAGAPTSTPGAPTSTPGAPTPTPGAPTPTPGALTYVGPPGCLSTADSIMC